MTSNVGSDIIAKEFSLGFLAGEDEKKQNISLREKVLAALKESFRPEFLNRIDEIIIFNYLDKEEIKKIVDLELEKVANRLGQKFIDIKITDTAKNHIAEKGFDPNLGARPLKRLIQREILDPLSLKIVSGEVKSGERVIADFENGKIVFRTLRDLIKSKRERKKEKVLI